MAKSLLEKLNTLLQSNVRNLTPKLSFKRLGKGIEGELAQLHQQIEAAQQDELVLQQQLAALEAEILAWDQKADAAVAAQQEAQARYAIEQMEKSKRRFTMQQSDLNQHQAAVYALMQQVTQLEALVKVAKQEAESALVEETPELTLSEAIRQAREVAQQQVQHIPLEQDNPVDEQAIEQDIKIRRSRLAKPE